MGMVIYDPVLIGADGIPLGHVSHNVHARDGVVVHCFLPTHAVGINLKSLYMASKHILHHMGDFLLEAIGNILTEGCLGLGGGRHRNDPVEA